MKPAPHAPLPQPIAATAQSVRTRIMAIVNLTPDSFSDGGNYADADAALAQALRLQAEGAAMLDLGAESTRPGAAGVSEQEEWARLEPALRKILPAASVPVSVDTYKAAVAQKALALGAGWVNDIWGLQRDQGQMAEAIAQHNAGVVIMHNRQDSAEPGDLIEAILRFWHKSLERALAAGICAQRIVFDPGIGFGKTLEQNWEVLRRFEELAVIGPYPLLLGASRKSFLGNAFNLPVNERDDATLATSVIAVQKGAAIVRTHTVKPHLHAIAVAEKLLHG